MEKGEGTDPWETPMELVEDYEVMGVFTSMEEGETRERKHRTRHHDMDGVGRERTGRVRRTPRESEAEKRKKEWERREWKGWEEGAELGDEDQGPEKPLDDVNDLAGTSGSPSVEEEERGTSGSTQTSPHFQPLTEHLSENSTRQIVQPEHKPLTPTRFAREVEHLTRYLQRRNQELVETDLQPQYLSDWRNIDPAGPKRRVPGSFNWLETCSDEEARLSILKQKRKVISGRNRVATMSFYPHSRPGPVITFANKKGEMIEELFDSIDTEEEMRLAALDEEAMGATKFEAAKALGAKLKRMRLRGSLEGAALEYYLNQMQPDVRMDYEKSKKALTRRFSSQTTSAEDRTEEARWTAIARMTSLKQGGLSIKEYVLELEALEDALPADMHTKLVESWLRGFTDERDGRTMRVAAKQEGARTPAEVAKAARTYFFAVERSEWMPTSGQLEVPVMAVAPVQVNPAHGQAPQQAAQSGVATQGEVLELLRQVSLQLTLSSGVQPQQNQNRSNYSRPNHQRSQSDAPLAYQQANPVTMQYSPAYVPAGPQQEKDPMRCYNCQLSGHRAMQCPSYNPRRDGPLAAPGQPPQLSAANSVDVAPVRDRTDIHVQRLAQVEDVSLAPGGNVLTSAVVDLFTETPVSAQTLAAMLVEDVAAADGKRARVEEPFYDAARDENRPRPQIHTKVPQVTRDHYINLLKDPEFRQMFLQEATEKLREDCAKEAALKRRQRQRNHQVPKIRALTEDEERFSGIRLLKRIPFMIAHPGLEDGIFSLADLLDVSPRLRQQVVEAMKSSETRKREKKIQPTVEDQMAEDVNMVAEFFACLVSSASELYALEESPQDTWLAEEEMGHRLVKSLFYTFGMLKVASKQGTWLAVGAMLVDAGALLNLITMVIVKTLGAEEDLAPVTGMHYRTAAGSYHAVKWKWRTTIKISRCQANITFFVTDTDAPYSVLLSRRFMAQAKMRADYEQDTYTMGDVHGTRIKVPRHNPTLTRPVSSGDIPVLVTVEDTPAVAPMAPPTQDIDVASVSADQTRTLVLEATKALLTQVKSDRPLLLAEGVEDTDSGKGQFQL